MKHIVTTLGAAALACVTATAHAQQAPRAGRAAPASALTRSLNGFGEALYTQLPRERNTVFSPASVGASLAMAHAGARGQTAAEIGRVLRLAGPRQQVHASFRDLLSGWNGVHPGYQLSAANRLWGAAGYDFDRGFVTLTSNVFGAPIVGLDFQGATEASRRTINTWVAERTQDRIRDLIPAGGLTPQTRLVLTNAVHFEGRWQAAFNPAATQPAPFHTAAGAEVSAPTMHVADMFRVARTADAGVLELPYAGGELAMVIVVPAGQGSIESVEREVGRGSLGRWLQQLTPEYAAVSLPRFRTEYSVMLGATLRAMGMPSAFGASADFGAMLGPTARREPGERIAISEVIHRAFIEVNEEGTEAAAATATIVEPAASAPPMPTPFVIDRAFVFAIRDLRTGAFLFMGRVADPTAS